VLCPLANALRTCTKSKVPRYITAIIYYGLYCNPRANGPGKFTKSLLLPRLWLLHCTMGRAAHVRIHCRGSPLGLFPASPRTRRYHGRSMCIIAALYCTTVPHYTAIPARSIAHLPSIFIFIFIPASVFHVVLIYCFPPQFSPSSLLIRVFAIQVSVFTPTSLFYRMQGAPAFANCAVSTLTTKASPPPAISLIHM
jgi:hypothetical protein